MKLLGSTGVVKKVGLVEWGFRLCQDSRVHGLLLSPLVLSPRRLPCLALSGLRRGLLGFSGVTSGLSLGARSRQKSSRKAPEAARRAQRSPQGGRREVTKRLRRPTGGPQGAPRGRGKRKTMNFTRWFGFAARKSDVNYVVLVARPLQNHGLAVLFLEKPRPNRHFWCPSCQNHVNTRDV